MDKKKIKIPTPKTRRTWKIKPYTRVKPSDKVYDRRRRKVQNEERIAAAMGKTAEMRPGHEHRFCPRCGNPLSRREAGDRERLVCSECEFVFYQNPVPAVATIIPQGDKIVMVKRAEEPRKGHWCLPAGFMELNESPQGCAVREAKEETGLDIRVKRLFGVDLGRDDPRVQVVLIIYLADILRGELRAGDDASDVGLFGSDELPRNIAFATHRRAIARFFRENDEQNTGP